MLHYESIKSIECIDTNTEDIIGGPGSLNNYAHFVAFADYKNRPSYFHAFKLKYKSINPCR